VLFNKVALHVVEAAEQNWPESKWIGAAQE
jgi:hypothetical protein